LKEKQLQLEDTQQLLQEKEKVIDNLQRKPKFTLYIGTNPIIKNQHKIGITEDAFIREESHKSSIPQFKVLFSYESENAKHIETMVKLL